MRFRWLLPLVACAIAPIGCNADRAADSAQTLQTFLADLFRQIVAAGLL